jgi:hypothetical protein
MVSYRSVCIGLLLSVTALSAAAACEGAGNHTERTNCLLNEQLKQQAEANKALLLELQKMRETVSSLKTSIDNLNAASASLMVSNDLWRAEALNAMVKKLNDVPASLASNSALIDAVAAKLLADPTWLAQVRSRAATPAAASIP